MFEPHISPAKPDPSSHPLELAQALLQTLMISSQDWHRLKNNPQARAQEQAAAALVYLLQSNPEEALSRLQQAVGWLDRSIKAPPCPDHGLKKQSVNAGAFRE
ncbi:DUF6439 family protein [Synechococcus sp. PCC 6312]|uniref:DUF6439 family protein n=1 Tax=Synechococcus sp. (strain ATCC 27167 / PCC 6312) TaxID=195253 RepID=UPI00029F286B|nr:DUF6439 family protein [Synechococcus sp. PCC 6312]AFY60175.1 hypothetical protein Syn6312_0975 [Synechococcus sp. PCC 6312]